jgi:hypothetical protein
MGTLAASYLRIAGGKMDPRDTSTTLNNGRLAERQSIGVKAPSGAGSNQRNRSAVCLAPIQKPEFRFVSDKFEKLRR